MGSPENLSYFPLVDTHGHDTEHMQWEEHLLHERHFTPKALTRIADSHVAAVQLFAEKYRQGYQRKRWNLGRMLETTRHQPQNLLGRLNARFLSLLDGQKERFVPELYREDARSARTRAAELVGYRLLLRLKRYER